MALITPDKSANASKVLEDLAQKLVVASERRPTPAFARVTFPEQLDRDRPVMPEQLLSLYGHPAYAELDGNARWRLGLLETVNFFSLNIHGEQTLVAELAERLYRERWAGETAWLSRYLQHFMHEENSHTYMLAEFCTRYYGRVMPEIVFRFENPALSRAGKDLLFYSRVYVLETLLDFVNRTAMRDEDLDPTVRTIHRSHHLDESRHIAFDRAVINTLVVRMVDEYLRDELQAVGPLIRAYAEYAFSRLINPRIYRELGLANPLTLAQEVQASERWSALKAQWMESCGKLFWKVGILAPALTP